MRTTKSIESACDQLRKKREVAVGYSVITRVGKWHRPCGYGCSGYTYRIDVDGNYLGEAHSEGVALYIAHAIKKGSANYPAWLLHGLHVQRYSGQSWVSPWLSKSRTHSLYKGLQTTMGIAADVKYIITVAAESPALVGYHLDFGYLTGPLVWIPEEQSSPKDLVAFFLQVAFSGIVKAAAARRELRIAALALDHLGNGGPQKEDLASEFEQFAFLRPLPSPQGIQPKTLWMKKKNPQGKRRSRRDLRNQTREAQ